MVDLTHFDFQTLAVGSYGYSALVRVKMNFFKAGRC